MQTKPKKIAPVHSRQTVSEALQTILRHNLHYLDDWEKAARSPENIEGVHQIRVALRRMRSALIAFRPAVPRSVTDRWTTAMRELAGQLGPARDLDVFIAEGLGGDSSSLKLPGKHKLLAIAQTNRELSYTAVRDMLDGDDYARFKEDFGLWLQSQAWLNEVEAEKERDRLSADVVRFARNVLDKQERRVLDLGTQINPDSAEEMHSLRIECKKLRYAAEFFWPVFQDMDEFIQHMKGLQDLQGVMNDVSVMHGLLDRLLADQTDRDVMFYAGALLGWRMREYTEMKATFDQRWEEFVSAKHPWWKKSAVLA